ncbi:MAG: hypothetical protein K2Q01_00490 [Rickettsiales bacterium]|nr:hypothetical protein [Rickettsiales bacterium]
MRWLRFVLLPAAMTATAAFAADWSSTVHIPQVSAKPKSPAKVGEKEKEKLYNEQMLLQEPKLDYQNEVINNPKYTDYGRANAAIRANEAQIGESGANSLAIKQDAQDKISEEQLGANIAIIRQEGASNTSSVTQNGKHNKAIQVQKGEKNSLIVDQKGQHNESYEEQIGKYNHKKKIQNGTVTETEEVK